MKSINVVIPVYNESLRLPETLHEYSKYLAKQQDYDTRLYIVDDGSTDTTRAIANDLISKLDIPGEVLSYTQNKGKGNAVKTGVLNSRLADYYYLADADLSAEWNVLDQFMDIIEKEGADVVIGSRAQSESFVKTNKLKRFLGRVAAMLIGIMLDLNIRDTQCGYKLFNKECIKAFELQQISGWGFDFEILYILRLMNKNIIEKGITWENKSGSQLKLSGYIESFKQLFIVKKKTSFYKNNINAI